MAEFMNEDFPCALPSLNPQVANFKPAALVYSGSGNANCLGPFVLDKPESTFGRDNECDHAILSWEISRKHAQIKYKDNHWWIVDLKSTNGLMVSGERLEAQVETLLEDGTEIVFAPVALSKFKFTFNEHYEAYSQACIIPPQPNTITNFDQTQIEHKFLEPSGPESVLTQVINIPPSSSNLTSENTEAKSNISKMLNEMVCTICTEYLVSPTSLGCSHVFCADCLDKWRRSSNSGNDKCPVCRKKIQCQTSVFAFEKIINIFLEQLLNDNEKEERAKMVQSRGKRSKPLPEFSLSGGNIIQQILDAAPRGASFVFTSDDSDSDEDIHGGLSDSDGQVFLGSDSDGYSDSYLTEVGGYSERDESSSDCDDLDSLGSNDPNDADVDSFINTVDDFALKESDIGESSQPNQSVNETLHQDWLNVQMTTLSNVQTAPAVNGNAQVSESRHSRRSHPYREIC